MIVAFTGLIADGGLMLTWTLYTIFTFWSAAALIIIRRRDNPSQLDLGFVRYGFIYIFLIYILCGDRIYEYVQQVLLNR